MRKCLDYLEAVPIIIYLACVLFLTLLFVGFFLALSYLGLWLVYFGAHRLGRWLMDVSVASVAWLRDLSKGL